MTDDTKIAETFNSFFDSIVNTLNIENDESIFSDTGDDTDPLLRPIEKIQQISWHFKDKAISKIQLDSPLYLWIKTL